MRLNAPDDIVLPPLNITLDLMTQFIKCMDRWNSSRICLSYYQLYPQFEEKIKEGVFVESEIRLLMKDDTFRTLFSIRSLFGPFLEKYRSI